MAQRYLVFALLLLTTIASAQTRTVGLISSAPGAFDGYTLLMPEGAKGTYLVDNCGRSVRSWSSPYLPAAVAYLIPGGRLLRTAQIPSSFNGAGAGGRLEIYDWDGNLVWGYNYVGTNFCQHHDCHWMPNGHILVIAWEQHDISEAIPLGRDTSSFMAKKLLAERIVELEPVGSDSANILWQWSTWDHMIQDHDSTLANYGVVADHPELIDLNAPVHAFGELYHFNAVDYNPDLDEVMVCSPLMDEIYVIDHSTSTTEAKSHSGGLRGHGGDILYRWGNPLMYKHGTSADQLFYGQHDAHWIDPTLRFGGKVMVFNNGAGRPDGQYSSIDIIDPPMSEDRNFEKKPDGTFGPDSIFWRYTATPPTSLYSGNTSGAQTLPNGNVLICESGRGRIIEVDTTNAVVWQYISPASASGMAAQGTVPQGNPLFRAYKYAGDGPELTGFSLVPGAHLEQNPIFTACDSVASVVATPGSADLSIYANPFHDELTIAAPSNGTMRVTITDVTGRMVSEATVHERTTFDTQSWAHGPYFARIHGASPASSAVRLIVKE